MWLASKINTADAVAEMGMSPQPALLGYSLSSPSTTVVQRAAPKTSILATISRALAPEPVPDVYAGPVVAPEPVKIVAPPLPTVRPTPLLNHTVDTLPGYFSTAKLRRAFPKF